jgi:hypothetical protein
MMTAMQSKPLPAPDGERLARLDRLLRSERIPTSRGGLEILRSKIQRAGLTQEFDRAAVPVRHAIIADGLDHDSLRELLVVAVLRERLFLDAMRLVLRDQKKATPNRDRKPSADSPLKNWLEPMPVYAIYAEKTGQVGYVNATGQRRQRIESYLRTIKAKPVGTLKKARGKPQSLFGFGTNLRVLDKWLGSWCPQDPESKAKTILREVLILSETDTSHARSLPRLLKVLRSQNEDCLRRLDKDSTARDTHILILRPALVSRNGWIDFVSELQRQFPGDSPLMLIGRKGAAERWSDPAS